MPHPHFTLIYDTYCGWCYGAAPVLDVLANCEINVTALHRYLFRGGEQLKMANGFGHYAEQMDRRIAELTGQPFSQTYVDQVLRSDTEFLDSGLTAIAAALVRPQGFKAEIALAHRLQRARFVEGTSAADSQPVITLLKELLPEELTEQQIHSALLSESIRQQAEAVAVQAEAVMQKVEATGVPTLICNFNNEVKILPLDRYFHAPETIRELVDQGQA